MDVRILGNLEVAEHGTPLELGLRKTRVLCALLAVHAPSLVRIGVIADALWPAGPPPKWEAALHSHVSRLRRALDPGRRAAGRATGSVVEQRDGAYALLVAHDDIDARRFERLAADARDVLAHADAARAAALFEAALGLWRGPALAEFADEPFAEAEARRLDELRLAAVEAHLSAKLALGEAAGAVAELDGLVDEHPLRERLWELLMLALYRCGRQAEALRKFQDVRRLLRDTLGVEPGPALRAMEARILDHDAALDAPARSRLPSGRLAVAPPAWLEPPGDAFVGRAAEQEALLGLVEGAARRGERVLVVVEGEPGIGKTRLVREACARARAHDAGADPGCFTVLGGRCDERAVLAYQPVVEALGRVAAAAPAELVERCGAEAPALADLVPDLRALVPAVGELTARDAETVRYLRHRAASAALSSRVLGAVPLLVLDDLHRASPALLDLLVHVLRDDDRGPLVVIATLIPAEAGATVDALAAGPSDERVRRISLSGLDLAGVSALVAARGGAAAPEPVHRMTGGNPFYVEELLEHAREAGGAGLEGSVPDSLRDTLARRLLRLPAATRRVLGIAAVAGEEFDLAVVATAARLRLERADDHLLAAARAGIVEHAGDGARYRFRHALIRAVLREGLGPGREARTHRILGEAYVANGRAGAGASAVVAGHFVAAVDDGGDATPAFEWSRRAAAVALERRSYGDAAAVLEPACRLLDVLDAPDALRAETLLEYASALQGAGDDRAETVAEQAYRAARRAGCAELQAHALLRNAPWTTPVRPGWAEQADETLEALDPAGHLWVLLTAVRALAGDRGPEASAELVRAALVRADEVPAQMRLDVYHSAYQVLHTMLSPGAALDLARRVLDAGRASPDPFGPIVGFTVARYAYLAVGDVARSDEIAQQYEELARASGGPRHHAGVAQRRAMRALLAGRFAEAESYAHQAVELQPTAEFIEGLAVQLLAMRLEQGRLAELRDAVADWAAKNERPAWRAGLAMVHAELGDGPAARAELAALGPGCARLPHDDLWLTGMCAAAHAAALLGDPAPAGALHAALAPHAERVVVITHGAVCWGPVSRVVAPLAALLGRDSEALAHYEHAMRVDEQMGALPFLARDRLGGAALLLRIGDERAAAPLARTGLGIARTFALAPLVERYAHLEEHVPGGARARTGAE